MMCWIRGVLYSGVIAVLVVVAVMLRNQQCLYHGVDDVFASRDSVSEDMDVIMDDVQILMSLE